jgi:hypothetical protein
MAYIYSISKEWLTCDCPLACMVWEALPEQQDRLALFNTELISWFINNLASSKGTQEGKHWSITHGVAIWYLWKWRNARIFRDGSSISYKPIGHIHCMPGDIQHAMDNRAGAVNRQK